MFRADADRAKRNCALDHESVGLNPDFRNPLWVQLDIPCMVANDITCIPVPGGTDRLRFGQQDDKEKGGKCAGYWHGGVFTAAYGLFRVSVSNNFRVAME